MSCYSTWLFPTLGLSYHGPSSLLRFMVVSGGETRRVRNHMTNVMDSTVGKWCLVSPTSDCAVWAIGPGINQLKLFSYLCFHDGKLFSGYST